MIPSPQLPQRIVSGGQTGVDRAALDVAIQQQREHGGWCPLGRIAEDGIIPSKYQLRETDSPNYWIRTEQNVMDSDGTLILYRSKRQGGTEFTFRMTAKHRRPVCCVDLEQEFDFTEPHAWIDRNTIVTLNVAGPRESSSPGIYVQAYRYLFEFLD